MTCTPPYLRWLQKNQGEEEREVVEFWTSYNYYCSPKMKEKNEIGESKWVVKPLSKISRARRVVLLLLLFKELFSTGKGELLCIRGGEEGMAGICLLVLNACIYIIWLWIFAELVIRLVYENKFADKICCHFYHQKYYCAIKQSIIRLGNNNWYITVHFITKNRHPMHY